MQRVILHCDLNSFYASVEELYHPEYRGMPLVVAGSVENRHGIVLAKNQLAKKYHIQTGEVIWQAKKKCPKLVVLTADFSKYLYFSNRVRDIFQEYTDLIEPFGIDEAWLDVTGSQRLFGDGKTIADTLRRRIREELGITASVGVSYNKIFAKLGSDYKKPDATTVITKENKAWIVDPLPVEDLLFVGKSTKMRLQALGIDTIGQLAMQNVDFLKGLLGKQGYVLWLYANGLDDSEVKPWGYEDEVKSIGNSTTPRKDICNYDEARIVLYVLAESVASRMRKQGFVCRKLCLSFRDVDLRVTTRQCVLKEKTQCAQDLLKQAMQLLLMNYSFEKPLRSIGIRVMDFSLKEEYNQLSLFQKEDYVALEETVDAIRNRFGFDSIKRGLMLMDTELSAGIGGLYEDEG